MAGQLEKTGVFKNSKNNGRALPPYSEKKSALCIKMTKAVYSKSGFLSLQKQLFSNFLPILYSLCFYVMTKKTKENKNK
jgi:hypothetical protein